jgi:hypothetical protein
MLSSIKRDWTSSTSAAAAGASSSSRGAAAGAVTSSSSSTLAGSNSGSDVKKGKGRASSDVIELDLDDEPSRRSECVPLHG